MTTPILPNTKYQPSFIVIEYPPNYDGELHIWAYKDLDSIPYFEFTLRHAIQKNEFTKTNETAWENLVRAARGILAQDERKRK